MSQLYTVKIFHLSFTSFHLPFANSIWKCGGFKLEVQFGESKAVSDWFQGSQLLIEAWIQPAAPIQMANENFEVENGKSSFVSRIIHT